MTVGQKRRSHKGRRACSASWDRLLRLIPGYDPFATAADGEWFDEVEADRVIEFFETCLTHAKGEWAGQPLVLEDWQKAVLGNLFGWKRTDGTRRYRECFLYVPRKNAKTTMSAGIANFLLFGDGEPGAEVYCAAADRDQAALLFEVAKFQVEAEPELKQHAETYRRSIVVGTSFCKVLSARPNTKHGFSGHGILADEVHAHQDRELIDVLTTSTGSRRQPLIIYLTTADYARESICNEKYEYACSVRDQVIPDPSFLPVVYEASIDDDWKSPETWKKANPNLGVSLKLDYVERECRKAQRLPTYENTFRRLQLNIRTEQDVRWLPMAEWDACAGAVDAEALKGAECWAGLDLSSNKDLTALVLAFRVDEGYALLPFFWVPADQAATREKEKKDRAPYLTWARQGLVTLTPGNVIDHAAIKAKILELRGVYNIREVAADPWNAQQLVTELMGEGFDVVAFRQGFGSMSAPSKDFETLMLQRRLHHGGHPVLRLHARNVMVELDGAGNYKPSKKKSAERIDGIVASVMAVARASLGKGATTDSPLNHGLTVA